MYTTTGMYIKFRIQRIMYIHIKKVFQLHFLYSLDCNLETSHMYLSLQAFCNLIYDR